MRKEYHSNAIPFITFVNCLSINSYLKHTLLFFSSNTPKAIKTIIKYMIQIPIFYLSLPFDFILHIKSNNIFVNLGVLSINCTIILSSFDKLTSFKYGIHSRRYISEFLYSSSSFFTISHILDIHNVMKCK